jgi:endonuclease YncB( thermonuclease family)
MGWPGASTTTVNSFSSITNHLLAIPSRHDVQQLTPGQKTCMVAASTTMFVLGWKLGRSSVVGRIFPSRFLSVSDIPKSLIGKDAPFLRGRVVSVSDGDTFRFYHVPTRFFHSSNVPTKKKSTDASTASTKLSEIALPVRVCTIDTPETAKFGKEGQPFGIEAREYLSSMVADKMVQIQVLDTDQYGRIVALLAHVMSDTNFGWEERRGQERDGRSCFGYSWREMGGTGIRSTRAATTKQSDVGWSRGWPMATDGYDGPRRWVDQRG